MGDRRLAWLTIRALIALLFGASAVAAHAQQPAWPTAGSHATGPSDSAQRHSAPTDIAAADAAPGIPTAVQQDDPADTSPDEQGGLDPVPRAAQPAVVKDGDPASEQDLAQLREGIVDVGEPLPPDDGGDTAMIDARPPEDIAVFENPPAGYDPLLFQIEDLDPISDNRATTRLFLHEPYDPVGIRIGSFVMFPELVAGGTWTSNVFQSPNAVSDTAFDLQPSARLVSNWSRHALEFRASGGLSYYSGNPTEDDRTYQLEMRGRLDISKRTNVQVLLSRDHSLESRSALDASQAGTRAGVTIDRAEAAFKQRFNRLLLQFRGGVSDTSYGDTENLGVVTSNTDRDYQQTDQAARASWEFKPTLSAFAEADVNQRHYGLAAATDLINRSSNGERYRAGLSFGNTGQILRGELSLGYGIQTPDDSRLHGVGGVLFDANATWRASELTSVLLSARTDVSETTTVNEGGAFSRSAGIEVRHQLRRYLVASAGLTYTTQDSQDGVINETDLRSTLGLEYYIDRDMILFNRYTHTSFNAGGSASDYNADVIMMGVRLRR